MPSRFAVLIGAAVLVLTLLARAQQPAPGAGSPATGTAILLGHVVDGDSGSPISAAMVAMTVSGRTGRQESSRVLTDQQGRFFYRDLAAGNYSLTASKPGWMTGAAGRYVIEGPSTVVEVREGERKTDLTIPMWRHATISGRVVDEAGEPLVGLEMRAVRLRYATGRRQGSFAGRARTDDRGAYRFSTLVPGDYAIVVPASVTSEPATFAGAIRADGNAMRPWLQTMTAVGSAPMSFDRAEVIAGTTRHRLASVVALPGLPRGDAPWPTYTATFHPSSSTLSDATIVRAVSGRDRSGVDLTVRLTPTYEVSGILTGPDGPAAYHAVHLLPADSIESPLFDVSTAVTDETGAFTLYGVPPGQYIARVVRTAWPTGEGQYLSVVGGTGAVQSIATVLGSTRAPASVPTEPVLHVTQSIAVGDRHARGLALILQPGHRIRGRAMFEGSAARPTPEQWPEIRVSLEPANGLFNFNVSPGVFAADGTFATPSTWPGRYLVRVAAPPAGWTFKSATHEGRDVADTSFDLSSDLDDVVITFTDRPTTLSGTVQASDDRQAARSAVLVFPTDPAGWVDYGRSSRRVQMVIPSSSGAFSLPSPPAGEYYMIAIPAGQAEGWQNPAVLRALAAQADRVQVREGQSLTHQLRFQGKR